MQGGLQHEVIHSGQRNAAPYGQKSLAESLKDINSKYDSYFSGKWHVGGFADRYLPNNRGFKSFLGKGLPVKLIYFVNIVPSTILSRKINNLC